MREKNKSSSSQDPIMKTRQGYGERDGFLEHSHNASYPTSSKILAQEWQWEGIRKLRCCPANSPGRGKYRTQRPLVEQVRIIGTPKRHVIKRTIVRYGAKPWPSHGCHTGQHDLHVFNTVLCENS